MKKTSAGLLMYRLGNGDPEVFLVHPGGPFWANKDLGAWSVPKGECGESEVALDAAIREFTEETGFDATGEFQELAPVKQASGKLVRVWAFEGDADPARLRSNTFELEWPPKSGRRQEFPEVDRGAWFGLAEAKRRIVAAQAPLLDELASLLGAPADTPKS